MQERDGYLRGQPDKRVAGGGGGDDGSPQQRPEDPYWGHVGPVYLLADRLVVVSCSVFRRQLRFGVGGGWNT